MMRPMGPGGPAGMNNQMGFGGPGNSMPGGPMGGSMPPGGGPPMGMGPDDGSIPVSSSGTESLTSDSSTPSLSGRKNY